MNEITIDIRGRDLIFFPTEATEASTDDYLAELRRKLLSHMQPDNPDIHEHLVIDKRNHWLRTKPFYWQKIKEALLEHQYPLQMAFEELPELPYETTLALQARPYQQDALQSWEEAGNAGVVVLPTGAGKTFVAALTIHQMHLWTLAVVPTIDLLEQWRNALAAALSLPATEIGIFGGGEKDIKPISIITYDSAALYPRELRRFGLLIFDECHHLPAPTYRIIAESAFTPLRLGLSATPERSDMAHTDLEDLIGPEVYRRSPTELTEGNFLAQYQEKQIAIALTPDDEQRYREQRQIYRSFLQKRRIIIRRPEDFQQKVIYQSARDPEARSALLAWREARTIAMNAPAKYTEIEKILQQHQNDQVILFSEYNDMVDEISHRFCIPSITYKTPAEERRSILERFRSGEYSKLASGRVLNEGVDVPDCRVAIIVSGNSTKREYIQRLGRILRPKAGDAFLYELITSDTTEENIARRRK